MNGVVYSADTHYFDGDCTTEEIDSSPLAPGSANKPINCQEIISKDQFSEEYRAILKEQTMEYFKQEQLREFRSRSRPKAQPKPTATAPKAGAFAWQSDKSVA